MMKTENTDRIENAAILSACCFTGNRYIPGDLLEHLGGRILNEVLRLAERGVTSFLAGGAIGFDTAAALAVIEAKKQNKGIRLVLVLPCRNLADGWNKQDRANLSRCIAGSDEVIYTAEQYSPGCMHLRNRHLVDHSAYCIFYSARKGGGAAYTVGYAKKRGLHLINLTGEQPADPVSEAQVPLLGG